MRLIYLGKPAAFIHKWLISEDEPSDFNIPIIDKNTVEDFIQQERLILTAFGESIEILNSV